MKLDAAFAIRFLLAVLAVYRVAMFTREDGPFGVFGHIRAFLGKFAYTDTTTGTQKLGLFWTLAEISNCAHCFGIWLSIIVAPLVIWPHAWSDILLAILAIAGLQSFLTGRIE